MGRKQNPEQRRRDLCDAAIQLLADEGIKGLTHLKVDRRAGVPEGTTSFYFRTSSALLHAVAAHIADLDLRDLTAATEPPAAGESAAAGLAALVMRTADGPGLVRSRARLELAMPSSRDPDLAQVFALHQQRFVDMHRDVVQRLSPDTDPGVVADRTYVLLTFISGLLLALSRGDRTIGSAEQLEAIIWSLCAGGAQPERG